VRVWAFQGALGTKLSTHRIDWAGLDRVMHAAAETHQYVILSLAAQGGGCDGDVWQDPAWYGGGYRQVQDPTGLTPMSYADYVTAAVAHFARSPALGMWEPISEAEASTCPGGDVAAACAGGQTCPDEAAAAHALRSFFDSVGTLIHFLDPYHPVEDGLLSGGECGTEGRDWEYVSSSPGIDVLSYHDYYPAPTLIGGYETNGVAAHDAMAREVGKPIIAGELGLLGSGVGGGCQTVSQRATFLHRRIAAEVDRGAAAVLLWNYITDPGTEKGCSLDIGPHDPALAQLRRLAPEIATDR
jgi:mannan endo-1,4-beta-mannosidase